MRQNQANYAQLSPLSFLARTAAVYPDQISVIHGAWRSTWRETYARARRLASALSVAGVRPGEVVAIMAPNIPAMVEAHFGVPMCGAVLNALNTRLDASAIAYMLRHGGARVLLADTEYAGVVAAALALLDAPPLVIDIADPAVPDGVLLGAREYEAFLAGGDPGFAWAGPTDEWDAIALNYTSGTTGDPKGVVYHHRGAYLNALSNILGWSMPMHPVYLWTLPMFHCNGWCFPWSLAAQAGVNVCLRRVEAPAILAAIAAHGVTHLCGAPIVFSMVIDAAGAAGLPQPVRGQVAASAPPLAMIEDASRIGVDLTHVYGLTETYGPASICAKHAAWDALPIEGQAALNARQGVATPLQESLCVLDPETLAPVPHDGETIGEIMFRGNITMRGYWKDEAATARAFAGGWFHTGDLAVVDADGYARIKDRSKDIIISGGENISSIEVEDVLFRHPAVLGAAVVAQPDDKWGESPCAFVELRPGTEAPPDAAALIAFCRARMAHFKAPRRVVFGPLPRTSTGKIQKAVLRRAAAGAP